MNNTEHTRPESTNAYPAELRGKIEKILSDILSDKYECRVTLHFEK